MAADDAMRIRLATRAGQLHSPTRNLPPRSTTPPLRRHALPPRRIVLDAYASARAASAPATASVAVIAEAVRATEVSSSRSLAWPVTRMSHPDVPGPLRAHRHQARHYQPDLLMRASAIDRVGDQLVLEAAQRFTNTPTPAAAIKADRPSPWI